MMARVVVEEHDGVVYLRVDGVPQDGSWLTGLLENLGFYFDYGLGAWVSVSVDRWDARRVVARLQGVGFECMGPLFYCGYPVRFIPDFSSELVWNTVRHVAKSLRR